MKSWVFNEEMLAHALRSWGHSTPASAVPARPDELIRAFLDSPAAIEHKLVMVTHVRAGVPLAQADIKEPKHGNPTDAVAKP